MVNILCIKWGTRYGPHYVNELLRGVRRNLRQPFQFYCCTDNATGLDPEVRTIPFPGNPGLKRGWPDVLVKLMVTQDGFGGLTGPTLFLDLDVIILDSIDCFFDFQPGKNCIIHNWVNPRKEFIGRRPAVGNSSVFRFEAGQSNYIYETFVREMAQAEDLSVWNTEQAFLTYAMRGGKLTQDSSPPSPRPSGERVGVRGSEPGDTRLLSPALSSLGGGEGGKQMPPEVHWWPEEWTRSYKRHCRPAFPLNLICTPKPPRGCRILVFHGRPDPDEAMRGYRGKRIHHHIKPAPWIADYWQV